MAATSSPMPLSPDTSPVLANTKRKVVLHQDHGHHHLPHTLEAELEISLVVILVVVHLGALCFWAWLLYASKPAGSKGVQAPRHIKIHKSYGVTVDSSGTSASMSPAKGRNRGTSTGTMFSSGHGGGTTDKVPEKASTGSSWRTPGEILASRTKAEKERLGKV